MVIRHSIDFYLHVEWESGGFLGQRTDCRSVEVGLSLCTRNCESESRSTVVLKITIVYIDGEYGRQRGGVSVLIWSGCEFIVAIAAKK